MAEEQTPTIDPVVQTVLNYRTQATEGRRTRMHMNKNNWNCYHLEQDYSHKKEGQSREFLAKQAMAVEQVTSFVQQGLVDQGRWFSVELGAGIENPEIKPEEVAAMLMKELDKNKFSQFIADEVKSGLLGSLMICKVRGETVKKAKYEAKTNEDTGEVDLIRRDVPTWQLKLELVRPDDWYPDPSGDGLFEIQRIEMDYWELLEVAKANPDIYDVDAVMRLNAHVEAERQTELAREQKRQRDYAGYRKRVTILECWGKIIEPVTGKVLYDNAVCAVANDHILIRPPKKNPFWHGKSPFVTAPIVRVPGSTWHKALMDAPTLYNRSMNELYNLIVDAGFMSVFGIKQLKEHYLQDPSQVADGIVPGDTLKTSQQMPPGEKVLERIDTGALSQEALSVLQLTDKEFQAASLTNDVRLGVLPQRKTKATEIVASNQTITGIFNGMIKVIESGFVQDILTRSWQTVAQNAKELDRDEMVSMFGEERADAIMSLSPEERFAATVNGCRFKVFGLSSTLNKIQDFRKVTSLLQTVGSTPVLAEEFQKRFSFTKLLEEIIRTLDVDADKLKKDQVDAAEAQQAQPAASEQPDINSQIPQASASSNETGTDVPRSALLQGITNPQ